MSTQLRRLAQAPAHSPARAKYFICVVAGVDTQAEGVVTVNAGYSLESVMTQTNFDAATDDSAVTLNGLYRDLGREVIVTDDEGIHTEKWRQVIPVANAAAEGVASTASLYVRVWSAAGTGVPVVRTG